MSSAAFSTAVGTSFFGRVWGRDNSAFADEVGTNRVGALADVGLNTSTVGTRVAVVTTEVTHTLVRTCSYNEIPILCSMNATVRSIMMFIFYLSKQTA